MRTVLIVFQSGEVLHARHEPLNGRCLKVGECDERVIL
jgi:hypothetical protein